MMDTGYSLHFMEDELAPRATATNTLPAAHRIIYVVAGDIVINGATPVGTDAAWYGDDAATITPSPKGARLWRWELLPAAQAPSALFADGNALPKLSARLRTLNLAEPWLMRCDSVAFPVGGCALLHTHQGPGIRVLIEGNIRIDSEGASHHYGIGDPWFEPGPEPVFAQASATRPSRFVRVMVLPARLAGKSSIRYVREAARTRTKDQTYRGYVEAVLGKVAE